VRGEIMKIAVTVNTYYKNNMTPYVLTKTLDSIYAQTHQDFKIFLIGDRYENDNSWDSITKHFSERGKLYYENLSNAIEREKYLGKDKMTLWCCGGCNALLVANKKALEEGFNYIAHLDHDDYWEPNHLHLINRCIEETNADWICTKSTYGDHTNILPALESPELFIQFLPTGGGLIHSSTCYNYHSIPLQVRDTYEEIGSAFPSDADLWERMSEYMRNNYLKGYCVNKITCHHDEEGTNLR
jgi:glycosyltransferase involved in cell wall biosynthesis